MWKVSETTRFCSHFHLYSWSNSILLKGSWGEQLAVIALWGFRRHGIICLFFKWKRHWTQSRILRLTNMNRSWKTLTVFLDSWKVLWEKTSLVKHVKLMCPGLLDIPAGPNTLLLWAVVWSVCLFVCMFAWEEMWMRGSFFAICKYVNNHVCM